jgi:hypothetical protein
MKNKELFKQGFVIGVTILFLIILMVPIMESAPTKNEKKNEINYYSLSFFTPRLYCFGSISNLSVNGTTYFFKAVNLRMLEIIGVNHNDWFMAYFRYKDVTQYINIYNTSFRGILRPHFICGVFKYIYS